MIVKSSRKSASTAITISYSVCLFIAADEFAEATFFLHAIADLVPDIHKLAVDLTAVEVESADVTAQRIFVVTG